MVCVAYSATKVGDNGGTGKGSQPPTCSLYENHTLSCMKIIQSYATPSSHSNDREKPLIVKKNRNCTVHHAVFAKNCTVHRAVFISWHG